MKQILKQDFLSEKCHRGNVVIYLGFSDLGGFIVESCRQIVDNKVTFWVVSVKYSEGGKVQTQSRKSAEKYFFKCPIKTHQFTKKGGINPPYILIFSF